MPSLISLIALQKKKTTKSKEKEEGGAGGSHRQKEKVDLVEIEGREVPIRFYLKMA